MIESNATINKRTWQELCDKLKGSSVDRVVALACIIGGLMVTSNPTDFAAACRTAEEYVRGTEANNAILR